MPPLPHAGWQVLRFLVGSGKGRIGGSEAMTNHLYYGDNLRVLLSSLILNDLMVYLTLLRYTVGQRIVDMLASKLT